MLTTMTIAVLVWALMFVWVLLEEPKIKRVAVSQAESQREEAWQARKQAWEVARQAQGQASEAGGQAWQARKHTIAARKKAQQERTEARKKGKRPTDQMKQIWSQAEQAEEIAKKEMLHARHVMNKANQEWLQALEPVNHSRDAWGERKQARDAWLKTEAGKQVKKKVVQAERRIERATTEKGEERAERDYQFAKEAYDLAEVEALGEKPQHEYQAWEEATKYVTDHANPAYALAQQAYEKVTPVYEKAQQAWLRAGQAWAEIKDLT